MIAKNTSALRRLALAVTAAVALPFLIDVGAGAAWAQKHSGGTHDHGSDSHGGHKGKGGKQYGRDRESRSPHGKSEEDTIFRGKKGKEGGHDTDHGDDSTHEGSGSDRGARGRRDSAATEAESDRRGPRYVGGRETGRRGEAGTKKGSIYADLWVLLRNPDGTPTLTPQGHVQPLDKDGNLLPLNADGTPVDPSKVVEVELSRLNVGRAPASVLDRQLTEVVKSINAATAIGTDTSGRIVVTVGTTTKTLDSPLANLALYKALVEKGYVPGINTSLNLGALSFLKDGLQTADDFRAAASFLGAAADKSGKVLPDTVVYLNQILRIGGSSTFTYSDSKVYLRVPAGFTYTRAAYDLMVDVLVKQADGSYVRRSVNLISAVFGGVSFSQQPLTGFAAFAQAADDALAVIQFLHDNPLPTN